MRRFPLFFWSFVVATIVTIYYPLAAFAQEVATVADPVNDLADKTPFEAWQYLVGVLVPLVVAFVIQAGWTEQAQRLAQLAVATVVGIGGELVQNGTDDLLTSNPLISIMKVLMVSQISYSAIWKARGLQVPYLIESKTGGDPAPKAP